MPEDGPMSRCRGPPNTGIDVRGRALILLLALAACDGGHDAVRRKAEVDAARDSLAYLNAMEERLFTVVDLDRETGRMVPVASLEDLRAVQREAIGATLDSGTAKARDELVLAIDQIARAQTESAAAGEAWEHLDGYGRAVESCDNWLTAQTPH
jgi:hypothetical protein